MSNTRTLTLQTLKDVGACTEQLLLFNQLFGESVEISESACILVADKFDWNWAANKLLSASAWQAYDEAKASAGEAYYEAKASAGKAYYEAKASAGKAYDEATASAGKAYYEATASAFAKQYIKERD
jgi:hypothetical protein